jgi:site-specific recombinase XerD
MTTDLFPKTRELISRSPFTQELTDFSAWLLAEHYTPVVVHHHLLRLVQALPRLPQNEVPNVHSLTELETAFDVGSAPPTRINYFQAARRVYKRFLQAHDRLFEAQPVGPFVTLQQEYADYLSEVRGLSLSSQTHHAHTVADFLMRGLGQDQMLSGITQQDVERFIVLRSREVTRHSLQHDVAYLRSFLRYCHGRGYLASRLDTNIETPRTYRGELPPRALPWDTVQALLKSIDRQSKSGWRDYCILHLIAHYGLRPSEVVSLRLDSIDWENAVLRVAQHKTRSALLLPLAPSTLQVLRDYLEQDRHQHGSIHPELFLRARCPAGPLMRTAIGDIFEKRMRIAKLPSANHNVYSLRHAFAMRLLARGVGIKTIGDVLGHRRLESTCTYLRLDIEALRGVALDVPDASVCEGGGHVHA